ncbi:MAG: hypothetical protein ABI186_08150 [Candidatus Elarobacter sp.]
MPLFAAPLLAGLAGAVTIAAASPAGAPNVGLYTSLPVSVVSCEQSSTGIPAMLEGPSSPIQLDNLRISFINRAAVQATDVRFAVSTPNGTQTIDDAGNFGPGARITHNFSPAVGGENFADTAKCAVRSVTFSDGTTWQPTV